MYRVLIHLDDADDYRMNLVLNNATNIKSDLDDVEIEIVAYAMGHVLFMKESNPYYERLRSLQKQGIKLALCNNTFQGMGLSKDDLVEGVVLVPSGAGEIVKRQSEGWTYIKP
jgi:intracellular sulfur oxidation DsrE/DsrF family protein